MLRTNAIAGLKEYLAGNYAGPVTILKQEGLGDLTPPYAMIRIGSAEDIGNGDWDIWEMNVIVAVFHDADATTIATAEAQATAVFAVLADEDDIISSLAATSVIVSAWRSETVEAGREETRWAHMAGFKLVAAPAGF